MRFNKDDEKLKEKVMQLLNDADDKSEAIYQAAEMIIEAKHKDLVEELVEQNARASADEEYRKRLGLHNL